MIRRVFAISARGFLVSTFLGVEEIFLFSLMLLFISEGKSFSLLVYLVVEREQQGKKPRDSMDTFSCIGIYVRQGDRDITVCSRFMITVQRRSSTVCTPPESEEMQDTFESFSSFSETTAATKSCVTVWCLRRFVL